MMLVASGVIRQFAGRYLEEYDPTLGLSVLPRVMSVVRLDPFGLMTGVDVDEGEWMEQRLGALRREPAAPWLEALAVCVWGGDQDVSSFEEAGLGHALLSTLRRMKALKFLYMGDDLMDDRLGDAEAHLGAVASYVRAAPSLEEAVFRGEWMMLGALRHARLRRLRIECNEVVRDIAAQLMEAHLPRLEELAFSVGGDVYEEVEPELLEPLWSGKLMPRLTRLMLRNGDRCDALVRELVGSPLWERLERLELSSGVLTDRGAECLCRGVSSTKVRALDVSGNLLSPDGLERLRRCGWRVIDRGQRVDEARWGASLDRYAVPLTVP